MRESLERLIKLCVQPSLALGEILEVKENSCTVELTESKKRLFKCSFNSVLDNEKNYLKVVPKVGSTVVVGMENESSFILSVSEVERIEYKEEDMELRMSKDGFQLERKGENLLKCLEDYIDEVNKIIVINGTTINVAKTTAIKERIKKILI